MDPLRASPTMNTGRLARAVLEMASRPNRFSEGGTSAPSREPLASLQCTGSGDDVSRVAMAGYVASPSVPLT